MKRVSAVIQCLIISLLVFIVVMPLLLVLINSFKPHNAIVANPMALPAGLYLDNFVTAWKYGSFVSGFVNSLKVAGTTVLVTCVVSFLAGYGLGTKRFPGENAVKTYLLVAMTIPLQLFLFPLYSVLARLNLIGNVYAVGLIIAAVNIPLAVMLMRTFFLNVPLEIEESARVDGANGFQILLRIMLPMVMPGLITVAVIVGLNAWNEFLLSSTFLQGAGNYTLNLNYRALGTGKMAADQGLVMAGALIIITPVVTFFLALQRYVVDGLVSGAVKG
jgi:raffinose/stachyose/melibiose transport system permease protein